METINIIITGYPNAGKSTITNCLTGTHYSESNTQNRTNFLIGQLKTYTPVTEMNSLLNNYDSVISLPYPTNSKLSNEWNYLVHDLVGASLNDDHKLKQGSRNILYVKQSKKKTDIIVVVFDINIFEQNIENNLELIKTVSTNASNPFKLIVVLNKCDNVIVTELNTTFTTKEDHVKFKVCADLLKQNGCDEVFPLCAINSLRISSGDNNMLVDEYEKECYANETLHNDSTTLLTEYGFNQLVTSINNFVTNNRNQLINKHILYELFDDDHNLKSIIALLNRMQKTNTGEEIVVANDLKKMVLDNLVGLGTSEQTDSFNGDLESTKKELNELNQKYVDIFDSQLDSENKFDAILYDIETKHLLRQVENGWYPEIMTKLYSDGKLTSNLLNQSVKSYINETNLSDVIRGISVMTDHNVDHLYDALYIFFNKYPNYLVSFRYGYIDNVIFDYIRVKLLNDEQQYAQFDFATFQKSKELFDTLNNLFDELDSNCETNEVLSVNVHSTDAHSNDEPSNHATHSVAVEEPVITDINSQQHNRCANKQCNKKKRGNRKY